MPVGFLIGDRGEQPPIDARPFRGLLKVAPERRQALVGMLTKARAPT